MTRTTAPRIVRRTSYAVALPGEGMLAETSGGAVRTVAAAPRRQAVPTGPFAVLCGSAMVELGCDHSLLYVREGMVCEFAPEARARWVVTSPLEVEALAESPFERTTRTSAGTTGR